MKDRAIVLDTDVPWPDGMRVFVVAESEKDEEQTELLARMDAMIPSEMTDEEFAEWEAHRLQEREEQKDMVRKSWEMEDSASK